MRNLHLTTRLSCHNANLEDAQVACIDSDKEDLYVATNKSLWKLNTRTSLLKHCIDVPQNDSNNTPSTQPVIALSYLSEQQDVCLTTDSGDIYLYNSVTEELMCIGSVDSGLQAAVWSPDGDIFVLSTGEQQLILMTREFIPIHEVALFSEAFGESEPVTVGWGKKETQFHGSEGKSAAVSQKKILSRAFSWDNKKPCISWRGDGQLFAVCAVDPVSDVRKIRIFSRDGTLQATSEDAFGLEAEISWRPSGSVIAAVQRLPNVYQIAFFEKNGLRHREFELPVMPDEAIVKHLMWNTDSTLLAVCLDFFQDDAIEKEIKPTKVLIWSMSNYHWYLKQTLLMPLGTGLRNIQWDITFPLMLHCVTSSSYLQYNWAWTVNNSQGTTKKDTATVAVIDGAKLLITPFRTVLIPPPMSAYELLLPCPVNQVVFATTDSPVKFAAILADNRVAFYVEASKAHALENSNKVYSDESDFTTVFEKHSLKAVYSLKWIDEVPGINTDLPMFLHHWQWISDNAMYAVYTDENVSTICKIKIDDQLQQLQVCSGVRMKGVVGRSCLCSDRQSLIFELEDGKLFKYSLESNNALRLLDDIGKEVNFLHFCTSVHCCYSAGKELIFGLTERYRLFCNNFELLNNATSFAVANNFLLVTTLDHKLRCIPLHCVKEMATKNYESESLRSIERGARIVVVVPKDTKVVLQMPRGNLETIHPRALVLSIVGQQLDSLQFCDAFTLMRKHRINMNLIYDHNPQLFLQNISKFVSEVNNVNWLNIFLSEVQDEDVTTTLYCALYPGRSASNVQVPEKVNIICRSVKEALQNNESQFFLPILTSLVMMKPPELDSALNFIKTCKDQQDKKITVDEALGYLMYLVDVNNLYNVALGTYDFDLVIMVAQKSQKDPKEYLPFLNDLRKKDTNYQKFVIDCHLKRPIKALEHISRCGEKYYSECLDYVRNNNLYKEALTLFPLNGDQYKAICTAYANHLSSKHCHEEAGLFYRRAAQAEMALISFEKSLCWQQAVSTAIAIGLADNQLQDLACRMAARLKDQHQHIAAAYLLAQYAKDYQESIITLLDGQVWDLALEKIHLHKYQAMIDSHLRPRLLDYCTATLATIEHQSNTLSRHTSRLLILREEKACLNMTDDSQLEGLPSDLISEISSVTGITQTTTVSRTTSRASARTSRNRRKHERKKQSLKEGSPFEDLALLDALTEIYNLVDKMRDECSSTLKMLVYFGYDKEAQKLQRCFKSLIDLLKINQKQIWQPAILSSSSEPLTGPDSTANSIAASMLQQSCNNTDFSLLVPPKTRLDHQWQLDFLTQ